MTTPPQSHPHIILSGGGTGGHLFPGLATAESLESLRPEVEITFVGTGPEWLGRRVREAGYRYLDLPCRPMPRRLGDLFRFAVDSLAAYYAAHRFLTMYPAAAVVGLGGYASVPMARAARARGIPLVLLEQNAVPGKATRFLARRAAAVCLALPEARAALPSPCHLHLTGNPVRKAFRVDGGGGGAGTGQQLEFTLQRANRAGAGSGTLKRELQQHPACVNPAAETAGTTHPTSSPLGGRGQSHFRGKEALPGKDAVSAAKIGTVPRVRTDSPQLLVLGGSGGAEALNRSVPEVLARLGQPLRGWRIMHQAGERDREATANSYAAAGLHATVVPWLDNMPAIMQQSTLAISRAGGTTLAELAAAGLPAVLVPYPHAADGHQRANARSFWASGAAEVVEQQGGPVGFDRALHDALAYLLVHPTRLVDMRAAMLCCARPGAADTVARLVLDLAAASGQNGAVETHAKA